MRFDNWTVALAALGVVSAASVAKAEEGPSSVITALASTTLSGYVDTSAQWNLGTGDAFVPPYKFNSPSKADGFNLDVVQVRIEKPLEETEWAAGYRVDLWAGPDASTLATQSPVSTGKSDFAIRQAYVALRMPVFNGINFKVGVFDSVLGYESVESPDDPNYTRSYGHTIEPQTHTGVLASYHFNEVVSASVGIADTTGPSINSRAFAPVQLTNPYAESVQDVYGFSGLHRPGEPGRPLGIHTLRWGGERLQQLRVGLQFRHPHAQRLCWCNHRHPSDRPPAWHRVGSVKHRQYTAVRTVLRDQGRGRYLVDRWLRLLPGD